jgi:hypothetical protein
VKETPAGKNANTSQKVLKSLEPTHSVTINVIETVNSKQLQQRLDAIKQFVGVLDENSTYDLLIQVDKLIEEKPNDNDIK